MGAWQQTCNIKAYDNAETFWVVKIDNMLADGQYGTYSREAL